MTREGIIRPERYCETVGFETPIAFARSLFDFPDNSISSFNLLLIFSLNSSNVHLIICFSQFILLGNT